MAKRRAARRSDAGGDSSPRPGTRAASAEAELLDEPDGMTDAAGTSTEFARADNVHPATVTDETDLEIELAVVGPDPLRDRARVRRLERACGVELDRCPVIGLELDPSPRAHASHRPTLVDGVWMSARAAELLASHPTVDELEHAAEWLRGQEGGDRAGAS